MRIHALDASGSFYVYRQKAWMALRHHAQPDDLIVLYDREVGKARRWRDVMAAGLDSIQAEPLKTGQPVTIFKWMEGRFLSCHDTLILYGDFCDADLPLEDTFWRTEFVVFGHYPGQRFCNNNVFIVGDYDEGYRVLPFPEHCSLR